MARSDRTHEGRIAGLEQGFESLRGEIHGIRTDLRTFTRDVRAELGHRAQVKWSPIIAATAVIIGVLSAFAAGPISDIHRIDEWHHQTQSNRFTSHDGAALQDWVRELYKTGTQLSIERHEMQQELFDRAQLRQEKSIERIWSQINDIQDEDFDRPEAEKLFGELQTEIKEQRQRIDNLVKEYYCGQPRDVR